MIKELNFDDFLRKLKKEKGLANVEASDGLYHLKMFDRTGKMIAKTKDYNIESLQQIARSIKLTNNKLSQYILDSLNGKYEV